MSIVVDVYVSSTSFTRVVPPRIVEVLSKNKTIRLIATKFFNGRLWFSKRCLYRMLLEKNEISPTDKEELLKRVEDLKEEKSFVTFKLKDTEEVVSNF